MRYNKHKFTMENQDQQNIQPDYDFILNQPGSSPTPQTPSPAPNRSRKKLIIVAVCAAVLIVVVAATALLAPKPQNSQTNNQVVQTPPATNPVDKFLTAIKAHDYTKAASYLPEDRSIDGDSATTIETTFSQMDLASCKVSPLKGSQASSTSDLTCRQASNNYGYVIHFQISQSSDTPFILNYTPEVVR
jgi:hypothetical protein